MNRILQAYAAILAQVSIIGFSFYFVKVSLASADPWTILAHRFALAGAGIGGFFLLKHRPWPKGTCWLQILPVGLFYPVGFFMCQTLGLAHCPSTVAGLISATTPIFTILLAWLILKERLSRQQKFCLSVSVIGLVFMNVMSGSADGADWTGVFFLFLSVLSTAFYQVFLKKVVEQFDLMDIVLVMTLSAALFFHMIWLIHYGFDVGRYLAPFTHKSYASAMVYLSIPSSLLTSFLAAFALTELRSSVVGIFNNIPPIVSIFAGFVFLGESVYWYHLIGVGLIIMGTLAYNFAEQKIG